jgi:hypothetical protein
VYQGGGAFGDGTVVCGGQQAGGLVGVHVGVDGHDLRRPLQPDPSDRGGRDLARELGVAHQVLERHGPRPPGRGDVAGVVGEPEFQCQLPARPADDERIRASEPRACRVRRRRDRAGTAAK